MKIRPIITLIFVLFIISIILLNCNIFVPQNTLYPNVDNENIIYKTSEYDLNDDGINETVMLYYNDHQIILAAESFNITLFDVDSRDAIFGNNPQNNYDCKVYIEGNKILIGVTYSFVNKYGTNAWLECYEYNETELIKIWSSDEINDKQIVMDSYKPEDGIITVLIDNEPNEMILDQEDLQDYNRYIQRFDENRQKTLEMDFGITPEYFFSDYDDNGTTELVTRTILRSYGAPISDEYICAYSFSKDGIHLKDSWLRSSYLELSEY